MPTITIQKGDTLSALAQKYGTSVAALMSANKDNPAVKSADLIIAGGQLNIPEAVGAPADGPAPGALGGGGSLAVAPVQAQGARAVGDLGNLRIALRDALTEAAQQTAASRMQQMAGLVEGGAAPSVISAAIGLAQQGLRQTQVDIFGDIMAGYKDAIDTKQREQTQINSLRLKFGAVIPADITSLDEALDFAMPLIDEENRLRLEKLRSDAATANVNLTFDRVVSVPGSLDFIHSALREKVKNKLFQEGYYDEEPPLWFFNRVQNQLRQSIPAERIKELWNEYRLPIIEESSGSKFEFGDY